MTNGAIPKTAGILSKVNVDQRMGDSIKQCHLCIIENIQIYTRGVDLLVPSTFETNSKFARFFPQDL